MAASTTYTSMEGYLAEIRMFAGNFAPRNWSYCAGTLVSINSNQALFSLLGTTYGGDGRTTFGLPDLRGRALISEGHGPGLNNYNLGQRGGLEYNYLNQTNLAQHTHAAVNSLAFADNLSGKYTPNVSNVVGDQADPGGNFVAKLGGGDAGDDFATEGSTDGTLGASDVTFAGGVTVGGSLQVANTGASSPVNNMAPYLVLNYIICTAGLFPSRN